MQKTWVQYLAQEEPLEKEMATHFSIPAWRIPWTKESDMTERLILMSTITNMLMDSGFLVASELLGSQEDNTL